MIVKTSQFISDDPIILMTFYNNLECTEINLHIDVPITW